MKIPIITRVHFTKNNCTGRLHRRQSPDVPRFDQWNLYVMEVRIAICITVNTGYLEHNYELMVLLLNTNLLALSTSSWLIVCPIPSYTFSVTRAFILRKMLELAYTRSTGTCGSGLLLPMNIGVPPKSPL